MALFRRRTRLRPPALTKAQWGLTDWVQYSDAPVDLVVGEHRNQHTLKNAAAARGHTDSERGVLIPVLVEFKRQTDNPYDANAWTANIDSALVGHLRKSSAAIASEICDPENLTVFEVAGLLRGGGGGSSYGVHVWPGANLTDAPHLPDDPEGSPVSWPPGTFETATRSERDKMGCPTCGKWPPNHARPGQQIKCERCDTVYSFRRLHGYRATGDRPPHQS